MAALQNAKHEAFARAIVEGKTGADAYAGAGYQAKPVSAAANAGRMLKNDGISQRIAELKAAAAAETVMNLREVLEELSKLGRADMGDYVALGIADPAACLAKLTPEQTSAIASLTFEETLIGRGKSKRRVPRVKKFTLHDKRGALAELRRHYEPQRHEHAGKDRGPVEIKDVSEHTPLELARRMAFLLELGARATRGESNGGE